MRHLSRGRATSRVVKLHELCVIVFAIGEAGSPPRTRTSGETLSCLCAGVLHVAAVVTFQVGFPTTEPGSITADGGTILLRTSGACAVTCSSVPMGQAAPTARQVLLGLTADDAPAPLVYLMPDFRHGSVGNTTLASNAVTASIQMAVSTTAGRRDVDVYCLAVDANNVTSSDAQVAGTKLRVRFLARACSPAFSFTQHCHTVELLFTLAVLVMAMQTKGRTRLLRAQLRSTPGGCLPCPPP